MKPEKHIDRRTFIKTTAAGCAIALSSSLACNSKSDDLPSDLPAEVSTKAEPAIKGTMPTRPLCRTGISVPILGLGGDMDWTINQSLLRFAFQMGITLWDSGNSYQNGKSEIGYGQYFSKYPDDRKKVFFITKSYALNPANLTDQLNLSLERVQTEYIDFYGLHGFTDPSLLTPEIKEWAEQKKKEGKIRLFGFCTHKNVGPLLSKAATLGWIDAVIATYNYQLSSDDDIKKAIEACSKAGVGIIAMKSQGLQYIRQFGLKGYLPGDRKIINQFTKNGYSLPQAKLKMVWENEKIASCLSEITNLTILKENVTAATDNVRLSSDDINIFQEYAETTKNSFCRGCTRCESVMTCDARIPDVLRYMMYYNGYGKIDEARKLFSELPSEIRGTIATRDYSKAEAVCPNKIQIGKAMKEAAVLLA